MFYPICDDYKCFFCARFGTSPDRTAEEFHFDEGPRLEGAVDHEEHRQNGGRLHDQHEDHVERQEEGDDERDPGSVQQSEGVRRRQGPARDSNLRIGKSGSS